MEVTSVGGPGRSAIIYQKEHYCSYNTHDFPKTEKNVIWQIVSGLACIITHYQIPEYFQDFFKKDLSMTFC